MHERGMIKWLPFASVVNANDLVKSIEEEKNKISHPVLLEDRINEIENTLRYSLDNHEEIEIEYYKNGHIFVLNDEVIKVDSINKIIYLKNNSKLHFSMLVKTKK